MWWLLRDRQAPDTVWHWSRNVTGTGKLAGPRNQQSPCREALVPISWSPESVASVWGRAGLHPSTRVLGPLKVKAESNFFSPSSIPKRSVQR